MNLLWLLVIIPGVIWAAVVAYLRDFAGGLALAGDDFRRDRFLGQLGIALLWPAWCWRRR